MIDFEVQQAPQSVVQTLEESLFTLNHWRVDPGAGVLSAPHKTQRLSPKQLAVLLFLAGNHGRIVTRDELLEEVWPESVVEEGALTRCVSELRTLLGDSAKHPKFIRTVPKLGYRMVTKPGLISEQTRVPMKQHQTPVTRGRAMWSMPWVAGSVLAVWLGWTTIEGWLGDARSIRADGFEIAQETRPAASTDFQLVPATRKALKHYETGTERLRQLDAQEAFHLLRIAAEEDPNHAGIQVALASALSLLGDDAQARSRASIALRLAQHLKPHERLWVASLASRIIGDTHEAVKGLSALNTLRPGKPEYVFALVSAQLQRGNYAEAVTSIQRLNGVSLSVLDEANRLLLLSRALLFSNAGHEALATVRTAKAIARKEKLDSLFAVAGLVEVQALIQLGEEAEFDSVFADVESDIMELGEPRRVADLQLTESERSFQRSQMTKGKETAYSALVEFERLGDLSGQAEALTQLARYAQTEGDMATAEAMSLRAQGLYQQVDNRFGQLTVLNERAVRHLSFDPIESAEHHKKACGLFSEALLISDELSNKHASAVLRHNLGHCSRLAGQNQVAIEYFRKAVTVLEDLGLPDEQANALNSLGHALRDEAKLRQSVEAFHLSEIIGRQSSNPQVLPTALMGLGLSYIALGQSESALRACEESLSLWVELEQAEPFEVTQLYLAKALIGVEDLERAQALIDRSMSSASQRGDVLTEGLARYAMAELLMFQGKHQEALQQLPAVPSSGYTLTTSLQAHQLLIRSALESALARDRGELDPGLDGLQSVLTFATQRNLRILELQTRFAIADAQQSGDSAVYSGLQEQAIELELLGLARQIERSKKLRSASLSMN